MLLKSNMSKEAVDTEHFKTESMYINLCIHSLCMVNVSQYSSNTIIVNNSQDTKKIISDSLQRISQLPLGIS